MKHEDIVYLQRLSAVTNVIPIISKSDARSPEELEILRRAIMDQLHLANIKNFKSFTRTAKSTIFAVCSVPSHDDEVMDASLLMSSEYIQPLSPSELPMLMEYIFDPDNVACMRHLAAKKLVRAKTFDFPYLPQSSLSRSPGISPYLQAKMTDHIQQEERLAQLKLAKWASDLQRNLQAERTRLEATAQSERNEWLVERLHEQVDQGAQAISSSTTSVGRNNTHSSNGPCSSFRQTNLLDVNDPFGLLRWSDAVQRRTWIVLQVAGGFGMIGAVAMWAAKALGDMHCWGSGGGVTFDHGWVWGFFAHGDK